MASPGVTFCDAVVPDATCSAGAAVNAPAYAVAGSAWVLYDSSLPVGGVCSGTNQFKPAVNLLATDFLQSTDFSTSICSDQAGSVFTFGVGGLTPPFDVSQLSTTQVTYAFAAGFLLVGMFWMLGRAVGLLMGIVKR